MSGTIEEAAKTWLVEPPFQKIFKHSFDVISDYICYGLTAVGTIALSIRLLSTLGIGDVNCMILGVMNSTGEMGPYPNGTGYPVVMYANLHPTCADASMTQFMQNIPFILLVQALVIIFIEKFTTKLPRISRRVERFYNIIVEGSLNGKNSDVAEDVCDEKANKEAISRRRQRNEVCNSLKISNTLYFTYILRKGLEQLLLWVFIAFNIYFGIHSASNLEPSICKLPVISDIALNLEPGEVHFQCVGKKLTLFFTLLYFSVGLQIAALICSTGSLVWCLFFRDITNLLRDIKEVSSAEDFFFVAKEGQDFMFLFDLLAHTSGIEPTLRVLTHADKTFQKICKPSIKKSEAEFVKVGEDCLKVVWQAARIEKWCKRKSTTVSVDSYEVTIFPAETSRHTITKMAKDEYVLANDDYYSASFIDLNGGKTEYIVTIACVIGKSRMKGERIITTLLPHGPERHRTGVIKTVKTTELEIQWEPPKGEFTKYVLAVDPCQFSLKKVASELRKISSLSGMTSSTNLSSAPSVPDLTVVPELSLVPDIELSKDHWEKQLSSKDMSATIPGLLPGEPYLIVLKTKTGDYETKRPLVDVGMTNPLAVESLRVEEIQVDKAIIKWTSSRRTLTSKAFSLTCVSKENKFSREYSIKMSSESLLQSFTIDNLVPATEFTVSITCMCIYQHLKTESSSEERQFFTKPLPPQNLVLDSQQCNSFTVKWERSVILGQTSKYKIGIQCPRIGYSSYMEVPAERDTFTFSKLPEIQGTGELYSVQIICCLMVEGGEEVDSAPLVGEFCTKPLPPTCLRPVPETHEVQWTKSQTPSVSCYKIRIRKGDDAGSAQETILPCTSLDKDTFCSFKLQGVEEDILYKLNVYAIAEKDGETMAESKELHEKVMLTRGELVLYSE